ncbi:AAA family ATPase [Glutamicibacter sp. PAEs-4]|uniref:AAA family ATPase n=1 Tax=Glutamicibacter sp. PAEs-4 TaxID=3444114 RepID=UPI003EB7D009
MIKKILLSGYPCFSGEAALGDLAPVNYVFGPNGSGKTTISQSLATLDVDDSHIAWTFEPQTVKVYNRGYVRKAFTNADGEERGVFLLGEDSRETFERIKELEKHLEKTKERIEDRERLIIEAESSLVGKREVLAAAVWDRRSVIPEVIRREMTGLNGGKTQCLELTLQKARAFPERGDDSFEVLIPKAEVAFSKATSEADPVPQAPEIPWDDAALQAALMSPIVGSADVALSEMIERLDISDWVQQGAEHLHRQESEPVLCPFCQQIAPEGLADQLANIFDDIYQAKREAIEAFQRSIRRAAETIAIYKERNLEVLKGCVEPTEVDRAFAAIEVGLKGTITSTEQKMLKPSDVVHTVASVESYAALKAVVDRANQSIEDANAIVRDRKGQRPAILEAAWREFVRGHLDDLINAYFKDEKLTVKKIDGLRRGIESQKGFLQECEIELRDLRAQTTSSEATIQTINDMLKLSQFHSFKLEKAQRTKGGYRIIRDDGQPANVDTLSEGERTFITFLYFYHSLSEVRQDGESEKICAVIDDPISSLDGDIMFVVSALTRDLIRSVRKEEHRRVSQIVLLTHNTRFHSEVSYEHKGEESPSVKFYRIRKFSPEPNEVDDCSQKNPIRSAYQELWDEVATARTRPGSPMPWLPNVLRRILESYFSTLGGQGNLYEIGRDLNPTEKALHDALIAWSHSGSHTIVDAEVFAQPLSQNDHWLDAFERIFERTSDGAHMGHYEMMMGEAQKYIT